MNKSIDFVAKSHFYPLLAKGDLIESTRHEFIAACIHNQNITSMKRKIFRILPYFVKKKILLQNCNVKKVEFEKCNYSEVDAAYLILGIKTAHKYGITLSCDFLGADCQIAQVSTIGTNGKQQDFNKGTIGNKPKIGFCVKTNPTSVISGPVHIGNFCQIAAGAIITKDVPPFSFVRGVNEVIPIRSNHIKYFLHQLYHRLVIGSGQTEGICWSNGSYYKSKVYSKFQKQIKNLMLDSRSQDDLIEYFIDFWKINFA